MTHPTAENWSTAGSGRDRKDVHAALQESTRLILRAENLRGAKDPSLQSLWEVGRVDVLPGHL